jgi:hypothetical protein
MLIPLIIVARINLKYLELFRQMSILVGLEQISDNGREQFDDALLILRESHLR